MLCRVVVNPTRSNVDYFFFVLLSIQTSAQQKYLEIVNKVQDLF